MSQSAQGERSTDEPEDGRKELNGVPFDGERAWDVQRKIALQEYGLWETYKHVPREKDREKPIEAYLPGGEEHGE